MQIYFIFFTAGWDINLPAKAYVSEERAKAEQARLNATMTQEDRDNGGSYELRSLTTADDDCDGDPNCEDCGCPAHDD